MWPHRSRRKSPTWLEPTVKVAGPQLRMRASEGCIEVRLPEFSKAAGVPSHSPMRKTAAGVCHADVMF